MALLTHFENSSTPKSELLSGISYGIEFIAYYKLSSLLKII